MAAVIALTEPAHALSPYTAALALQKTLVVQKIRVTLAVMLPMAAAATLWQEFD